jgi:hypothetical protein
MAVDSAPAQQKACIQRIQAAILGVEVQFSHHAVRVNCTLIAEQVF